MILSLKSSPQETTIDMSSGKEKLLQSTAVLTSEALDNIHRSIQLLQAL